jgi:glycosyltransferase involved in cell wall biosynthesis
MLTDTAMVKISVIIPCHNDGHFLPEAVSSVLSCRRNDLEIIIVDDGSTNEETLSILNRYKKEGIKVLSHPNSGLAFTRNRGIREAKGVYILPLDADNKIKPQYVEKGVKLLDTSLIDIVYAKPFFFGDVISQRKFNTHEFDGDDLFFGNYIDACALYRKSVWEKVGGYDENMPSQGNEDWEFWLHCHISGFKFKFLDEQLYDYRINENSMISCVSQDQAKAVVRYILTKHSDQYIDLLNKVSAYKKFHENDQRNYLRTSIKYFIKLLRRHL